MTQPHFILSFLPFWIVTYGLAVLAWTCIGRFLLQPFVRPDRPNPVIRVFWWLTAVPFAVVRALTPLYVASSWIPLVAALWLFALRYVAAFAFLALGMAPRLSELGR